MALETSALKLLLYNPQPGPWTQGSSRGGGGGRLEDIERQRWEIVVKYCCTRGSQ